MILYHILYMLFFSVVTPPIYCSEPIDTSTCWIVKFAHDEQNYLCPPKIIQRLAVIKAAKAAGFDDDTSQELDLSHTPSITAEKFDALVALMHGKSSIPADDQKFLELVSTTDTLLEEDDATHQQVVDALIIRVKSKEDTYHNPHSPRRQFFDLFSNKQAAVLVTKLRNIAHNLKKKRYFRVGNRIFSRIEGDSYQSTISDYKVNCSDGTEGFPIPDFITGKPCIAPLPTSIQTLIDAGKMPDVHTGLDTKESLSLYNAGLTSFNGLPAYPDFPNLSSLNLNGNYLTHIPAHAFANMPNLKEIFLKINRITTIDPEAFSGLLKLEYLDLNDNQLPSIDMRIFTSLPTLISVDLTRNKISSITLTDGSCITHYRYTYGLSLLQDCSVYISDNPIMESLSSTPKTIK